MDRDRRSDLQPLSTHLSKSQRSSGPLYKRETRGPAGARRNCARWYAYRMTPTATQDTKTLPRVGSVIPRMVLAHAIIATLSGEKLIMSPLLPPLDVQMWATRWAHAPSLRLHWCHQWCAHWRWCRHKPRSATLKTTISTNHRMSEEVNVSDLGAA